MVNTGYKQAIIAYKVSKSNGEPLDIDGNLTRVSGKKQAISLLTGYNNPDPSKYEVESYFDKEAVISGNSTISLDQKSCPVGFINISIDRLILEEPVVKGTFTLESTNEWHLIDGPTNYVELDYTSGSAGIYTITATGVDIGDGFFVFQNIATYQTATIYIANLSGRPWILETGNWNNLGFWYSDGIWNY